MKEEKRGWKKKRRDWKKPYKPTPYDLERDPTLAEERPAFDWTNYRQFKARERELSPHSPEDVLHRTFK
jgi:hypothetical protein